MLKSSKIFIGLLPILILLCHACQQESSEAGLTPVAPSIHIPVIRTEEELMHYAQTDSLKTFFQKYPAFSEVYMRQVLALPYGQDSSAEELLFMTKDSGFRKLFCFSKAYRLFSFLSGFTYQCFLFDDQDGEGIGLGLDLFLGNDFPYSKIDPTNPAFSSYLTRSYTPEHIPRKIAEVLVEDLLPPPAKNNLLHFMIREGKKLYCIDQILSFLPDTIVLQYSEDQLNWCQSNEVQMWDFFFEKDLFYDTDFRKINKYISPAPTSPGMPPESPGATANYLGWRIVQAYKARYKDLSLSDLLEIQDAQKILEDSKFKPRRTT